MNTVPQRLFMAAARELPRIEAMESLRLSQVALFSNPNLKPATARDLIAGWQAQAAGEPAGTRSTGMGALAAMQIANEEARAKGELWEQLRERGEVA
jgi:tripartite-type tricarboxylate transporter receptor subunit TctC